MRIFKEFVCMLRRFKTAGLLNVFGLAVAFAVFTVISVQLAFQEGYDRFHKDADRIYRLELLYPMTFEYSAFGPVPIGRLLKEQSPGVTDYFIANLGNKRLFKSEAGLETADNFYENYTEVTPSFVDMLGLEILQGDGKQALTEPGMMMIPLSIAGKWFGNKTAVGKQMYMDGTEPYTVAAVYKDIPLNSIFKNCCYGRFAENEDWGNWGGQIYVLGNTGRDALQKQVDGVKMEVLDQIFEGLHKKEQMRKEGKSYLRVSPLTGIYYDNTVAFDHVDKGNRKGAAVMFGVGILIILIAGVNFINFSMSLAPARMKNINTRKVLGATRWNLCFKLIGEAVLYTFVAFLFSVGLLQLFSMSDFAHLFPVPLAPLEHLPLLVEVGGLALLLGVLTGIYPAFYITSFEPALVLKGSFVMTPKGIRLRNTLMAFQFVISIVLITSTLLMGQQHRFMRNYSVGYKTDNIACLKLEKGLIAKRDALMSEMTAIPGVIGYTFSDYVPGNDLVSGIGVEIDGEPVRFDVWHVYKNFVDFFDIPVVKGDGFSGSDLSEEQIMMNETALKMQPVVEKYLGRNIQAILNSGRFTGVVSDIHYMSLRKPVGPLAVVCTQNFEYKYMFLKLSGTNTAEVVEHIKGVYGRLSDNGVFDFKFLDETLQKSYESEKVLIQIISIMGAIAIILALVGVYGLVVFNAQYKRKEIGIRKVSGASETQILVLLNRNFFRLLVISFVIACPVAWFAISRWLEGFAYKTEIHWWVFLLAGLIIFGITLLTISWQSWRAATENPVDALKSE